MTWKAEDLTGKRFGKLVALKRIHYKPNNPKKYRAKWECVCDCGNHCAVLSPYLVENKTKSCGCDRWRKGVKHANWKNGKISHIYGYVMIHIPGHKRAIKNYVLEHIFIVEKILGTTLREGVVIHHVNGDRKDNSNNNLVVCENQAYHMLLHQRERALKESGDSNNIKCPICKEYDSKQNLIITKDGQNRGHKGCANEYKRINRLKKKN